jgi:hypothetical protein
LKSLGAILFFIIFFAQTFNQFFIVFGFYANRSYYTSICENKARPILHCNGKCQLAKKLRQEEKKDQQNPQRRFENKTDNIIFLSYSSIHLLSFLPRSEYAINNTVKPIDFSFPFFHPPSV